MIGQPRCRALARHRGEPGSRPVRRSGCGSWRPCEARDRGQATVEFALVLPLLIVLLWTFAEIVVVLRDHVLVTHAAREAARVASVQGVGPAALAAARDRSGLGDSLRIDLRRSGSDVHAVASLAVADDLPILGRIRPGLTVSAAVVMLSEAGGEP